MNQELGVFTGEFTTNIEESATLYGDKYLELLYKTAESFRTLQLSKEEVAILRVITLTFPGQHVHERSTVKSVLKATCIKQSAAFKGYYFRSH